MLAALRYRRAQTVFVVVLSALVTTCLILAPLYTRALEQANIVADALVKRADESFQNREQLAQARLEAQLKPVADTLAKFQEQAKLVVLPLKLIFAGGHFGRFKIQFHS